MAITLEQMRSELVGRRFPGGTFTIERWESRLFADVMECDELPREVAHPAYLFHAPLAGVGLKYGEIFALCHAESDEAIRAGEYDWTIRDPLLVGHTYRMSGGFTDVVRKSGRRAGLMDVVSFEIEVHDMDGGSLAAHVRNTWIFLRTQ